MAFASYIPSCSSRQTRWLRSVGRANRVTQTSPWQQPRRRYQEEGKQGGGHTEDATASASLDSEASYVRNFGGEIRSPHRCLSFVSFRLPSYTRLSERELLNYPLSARSDLYSRLCSPPKTTVGRSGACRGFYSNITARDKNEGRTKPSLPESGKQRHGSVSRQVHARETKRVSEAES